MYLLLSPINFFGFHLRYVFTMYLCLQTECLGHLPRIIAVICFLNLENNEKRLIYWLSDQNEQTRLMEVFKKVSVV